VSEVRRTIDAVWKLESAKIVGGLARIVRDVGVAEELAQDALVAALEQWPAAGIPDNPGAWLTTVARRRAIDHLRRAGRTTGPVEVANQPNQAQPNQEQPDREQDDVLRLVFVCCHPALPRDARVALTLRLVAGLTAAEIARAFLLDEPQVVRRIAAAKQTLAAAGAGFARPSGADFPGRLASVLEVVYLIFNEGYSATAGEDWLRPALCEDAQRLGRVLAELVPNEPEVHGLVALMEIQASRSAARVGRSGEPILLPDQNRARWDQLLIRRGLAALERAERLGGAQGPYAIQAAIAACHARARTAEETDWARIAALYEALTRIVPSPVVELNRAVAVAMAFGPAAGLSIVDALIEEPSLARYHLLPGVRGDLLAKLGRFDEARVELERAASLTRNERERELLLERAEGCARAADRPPGG
jgi:RNA polymerase sigma factor (sigma-70 family)